MFDYIQGKVVTRQPTHVVVEAGGIGYLLHITLNSYDQIEEGKDQKVFTWLQVQEDAHRLWGFKDTSERDVFLHLVSVSGIGPRLARAVLSGMPPDDLVSALAAGDLGRLSTIPGIGKKTAERMVLELREKVRTLAAELPGRADRPALADQDVVSALVNLGYKAAQAERAVAEVMREKPGGAFHEILRASLNKLSRA